jgi:hypothetical protein
MFEAGSKTETVIAAVSLIFRLAVLSAPKPMLVSLSEARHAADPAVSGDVCAKTNLH